jgi:hypothetical protein
MAKALPIVFICAPYTARRGRDISYNIRLAASFARQLAQNRIGFICPHTNSANMHDVGDIDFWYDMYLAILELCDAILVVGNYAQSSGCRSEIALAEKMRIPLFYSFADVVVWAQKREK